MKKYESHKIIIKPPWWKFWQKPREGYIAFSNPDVYAELKEFSKNAESTHECDCQGRVGQLGSTIRIMKS